MGLLKAQILKYSPPLRIESKNTEFHFLTVLSKYSLIIVSTFNKTSFVPLSLYEQGTSNPLLFLFSRRPVTTAVIFPPEYNARSSPSNIALTTHLSFIFLLSVENTAKLN